MPWKPSTRTTGYDAARVKRLAPLADALDAAGLPPLRLRKLGSILNALETQIEDGGDHPEADRLLIEALRVGTLHQMSKRRARRILAALDDLEAAEAERWEQVRAGTLPPLDSLPENRLDDLMQEGYDLMSRGEAASAADLWLKAWKLVRELATPEMVRAEMLDAAFPGLTEMVFNWSSDLEEHLGNMGISDPSYYAQQVRYVDEFLSQFPDEADWRWVQMLRAKGQALFHLGRQEEGDALYACLIKRCPNEAWAYIGWSDNYAYGYGVDRDGQRAEQILLQALERGQLNDRQDAVERLAMLYGRLGQTEAYARTASQLPEERRRDVERLLSDTEPWPDSVTQVAAEERPGRNDPCWCGSGRKYKDCHWRQDRLK